MTGCRGRFPKILPTAWNLHGPYAFAAGLAIPFLRLPAACSPTPHADEGHRRSGEVPPFPANGLGHPPSPFGQWRDNEWHSHDVGGHGVAARVLSVMPSLTNAPARQIGLPNFVHVGLHES